MSCVLGAQQRPGREEEERTAVRAYLVRYVEWRQARAGWAWRLRPPSLDDSRCDVFHETNTRIARSPPYRALSSCSLITITIALNAHRLFRCSISGNCPASATWCSHFRGPLCRCRPWRAQPCEVLMTTARSHALQQPCRCLLVWFAKISILAHGSVVSASRTARLPTREPPPYLHTPHPSGRQMLFLGTAASRASGTVLKHALLSQTTHPCPNAAGLLGDLLALSDSAWRRD